MPQWLLSTSMLSAIRDDGSRHPCQAQTPSVRLKIAVVGTGGALDGARPTSAGTSEATRSGARTAPRLLRRALLLLGRFTPGVFVVGLAPGGLRQFDSRLRGSVIGGERQRCQQECRQSGAGEKAAGRKTHACRVCHGCPCVKFLCAMKMPLDAPG